MLEPLVEDGDSQSLSVTAYKGPVNYSTIGP